MIKHCLGQEIVYFCSNPSWDATEVLVNIDIDCHEKGTKEGALQCANWIRDNLLPNMFHSLSTNGIGRHGYICINKVGCNALAVDKAILNLESYLRAQHKIQKWDIEGIEVRGRPPIRSWGEGHYNLEYIKLGSLAKLPVDALMRPEELMSTTVKTVTWLRELEIPQVVAEDGVQGHTEPHNKEFGRTDPRDFDLVPYSMRDREWCKWVEWVAQHGLPEPDCVGTVLFELAKWLLWVELYGESPDVITSLLTDWLMVNHNGYVTRINEGLDAEVRKQVGRAVKTAGHQAAESKELFCRLRQKRSTGQYKRLIYIQPYMDGEICPQEGQEERNTVYFKYDLKDSLLPPEVESKLAHFIAQEKMRKKNGEYPFLRFARRFLNCLWDNQGSCRIPLNLCLEMSSAVKPHLQLKHKKHLAQLGLIHHDWEVTIRRYEACALYKMTAECKELFEQHYQEKSAREQLLA